MPQYKAFGQPPINMPHNSNQAQLRTRTWEPDIDTTTAEARYQHIRTQSVTSFLQL